MKLANHEISSLIFERVAVWTPILIVVDVQV